MKRLILLCILLSTIGLTANSQITYWTSQSESIFSLSNYSGANGSAALRFSILPNSEYVFNMDGKYFGGFVGIGLRNIGLIWTDTIKHKRRAQTVYIPAHLKFGNLDDDVYFTIGGELDMLYHLKEKDWVNGDKQKNREWLSDKVNQFIPSLAVGFNYKFLYFRLRYQMIDFFNPNYTEVINGINTFPYRGVNSQIFFFSIAYRQILGNNEDDE